MLEKPDNRSAIESALRTLTENCTTISLTLALPKPIESIKSTPAADSGLPIGELVNLHDGKKALQDPNVTKIVDIFKGRIIDIQHNTNTPDSP